MVTTLVAEEVTPTATVVVIVALGKEIRPEPPVNV
jgi:hypothetical protein